MFAGCGGHIDRAARAGDAATVRKRMAGVIPDSARWKRDLLSLPAMRSDTDECSERNTRGLGARRDHRGSRLTRRNHIDIRGATQSVSHIGVFESTADERASMDRIDRRTQNCDEIVSKR